MTDADHAAATATDFLPDGDRARAMDRRMGGDLLASLCYVAGQVRTQAPQSDIAGRMNRLERVTRELSASPGRIHPACFSAYYRLVLCIAGEETEQAAASALDDLFAVARVVPDFRVCCFDAASVGGEPALALYRRALDTDTEQPLSFLPPDPAAAQRTRACVDRALALMDRSAPALAAEFAGLVAEIILAAGPREPGRLRFDGASSYQLWGALALNVDEQKTDLEMMEALAHEAGHSFLFGMTIDEPLVQNGDDERYRSPLRRDPRPMDGIYHATWVSARMHYAMAAVRASGALDDTRRQTECEVLMQASRRAFADGDAVVAESARLSRTGQALMNSAREFMQSSR